MSEDHNDSSSEPPPRARPVPDRRVRSTRSLTFAWLLDPRCIPPSRKSFIEQSLHRDDWPPTHAYGSDPNTPADVDYHRSVGYGASRICKKAEECENQRLSEAEWNTRVYSPLLDLVVEHPKYNGAVKNLDITTARIKPKTFSMIHSSEARMGNKMVDYAICLEPDVAMEKAIRMALAMENAGSQSVNQTMFQPLRLQPIAVNVKCKLPFSGGETSDVQLAKPCTGPAKCSGRTVKGLWRYQSWHDVHLSVIKDDATRNVMVYGKIRLGGSDSLLGVFQMIKGIDVLVDWANSEYRSWYMSNVLPSLG